MATYKTGRYEDWQGVKYYAIHKKTLLWGWEEVNYWVISRYFGYEPVRSDSEAKKEMMDAVDRLVRAGHTVT
jgi:hypothetical protein